MAQPSSPGIQPTGEYKGGGRLPIYLTPPLTFPYKESNSFSSQRPSLPLFASVIGSRSPPENPFFSSPRIRYCTRALSSAISGLRDRLQRRRKRIRIVDPPPPPPWLLLSLLQHPPNFQERRQQVRSARKAALGGERGGSDRSWGHGGKRGRSRLGGGKREGYLHPAIFLSRATVFSARFLSRSRRYGDRRRGAHRLLLRRR